MDPVTLEQLFYELLSPNAATVEIPADRLTPGCVIATPEWARHVVTATPNLQSAKTLSVPVRHLHGGHDIALPVSAGACIEIYRHRLAAAQLMYVPTIPRCVVPENPNEGDRVVQHFHDVLRLGEGRFYEYTGQEWQRVENVIEGDRSRTVVRTFPLGIDHLVNSTNAPSPLVWSTYLPADHLPHLYVDGVPMPARTVDELCVGDVIRFPGGGRLGVTSIRRNSFSTTIVVSLVQKSIHFMRHFMWDRSPGVTAEHHDSRRTGTLYPTEPRAGELICADQLDTGDTVITPSGYHSAVATVDDVWEEPLQHHMNVRLTTGEGRSLRVMSSLEAGSYYLLHRPALTSHRWGTLLSPLSRSQP
ncbi:hypothetical protein [Streptomyces sp. NPDC088727]|uniref:hypothetical protein n=1 Tax=Streptomyces sp. NPDC088727 TaxID=3365875 RepID=UPI0037FFEF7F